MQNTEIRESGPSDIESLKSLYPRAFPDEDLLPLVTSLLAAEAETLSLIAQRAGRDVGHILFTRCDLESENARLILLGPLAVAPKAQRSGVGSALIKHGARLLQATGATQMFVLGDPNYYQRFGFKEENAVSPPYPLPPEWKGAWRSLMLGEAPAAEGTLRPPPPWRRRELWTS